MPRKPKVEKQQVNIVVNGSTVTVIMHPPTGAHKSWRAYWTGLPRAKSTGQRDFNEAVKIAENMLRNGGNRATIEDAVLSDEEFDEIQRAHYRRQQDSLAKERAETSLEVCLDAISAFRDITGLKPVTIATPDDCAAFQRKALKLPKSTRLTYPNARRKGVGCYSPSTVLKWSRALQAAFERANINGGKKCVRGVVNRSKLLTSNPWVQFTWIEDAEPQIRQFTPGELLSILDYFDQTWPGVTVANLASKVALWSWSRLSEFTSLKWEMANVIGDEIHLEIHGKCGVEKWARIPSGLYQELLGIRSSSPYMFAAYIQQLIDFYLATGRPKFARKVNANYKPRAFGDWFQERIPEWALATGRDHATPHTFRKTALQFANDGAELSEQVAEDAALNVSVMLKHYLSKRQRQLRQASNRTFQRILTGLPTDVAVRYGYVPDSQLVQLKKLLRAATEAEDWARVVELGTELKRQQEA